jgi:hypothetical protein
MARILSTVALVGSIGNVSAYKMRGSDKIILRTKGGPSGKRIRNAPEFDLTRRNNSEFSGRATASKWIMSMLSQLKPLADHNIAGPLNALMKPIQELDKTSDYGMRNVVLSGNPRLLEGFSLNRGTSFDSMLRSPLPCSLSRETLSARVEIPALLPGINFHAQRKDPMFSIIAMLGIVPDLFYDADRYKPSSHAYTSLGAKAVNTDWYPVLGGAPATTLELKLEGMPPDQSFSLMLSVGICFGAMHDAATIKQVKHAGSAKVLAMA